MGLTVAHGIGISAILVMVLSASACSSGSSDKAVGEPLPDDLSSGTFTVGLEHGGLDRTAVVFVPESYSSAADTPLVLNFHGFGVPTERPHCQCGFGVRCVAGRWVRAVAPNASRHPSWNARPHDSVRRFGRLPVCDGCGGLLAERKRRSRRGPGHAHRWGNQHRILGPRWRHQRKCGSPLSSGWRRPRVVPVFSGRPVGQRPDLGLLDRLFSGRTVVS